MPLKKILETFIGFFSSFFKRRKYVDTLVYTVACTVVFVGPAGFVFNAYAGRNTTCPLFRSSNKNDGHAVALTVFLRLLVKTRLCSRLTSFYGTVFVEVGQFINSKSFHLGRHFFFFHLLTPPHFGALNRESESSGRQPVYRKLFPRSPHSSKNYLF